MDEDQQTNKLASAHVLPGSVKTHKRCTHFNAAPTLPLLSLPISPVPLLAFPTVFALTDMAATRDTSPVSVTLPERARLGVARPRECR